MAIPSLVDYAMKNIASKTKTDSGAGNSAAQNAAVQTGVVNKANNGYMNSQNAGSSPLWKNSGNSSGASVTLNLGNGPITLTEASGNGGNTVSFNGKNFNVNRGRGVNLKVNEYMNNIKNSLGGSTGNSKTSASGNTQSGGNGVFGAGAVSGSKTVPNAGSSNAAINQSNMNSGAQISGQGIIPQNAADNPYINENGNRTFRMSDDVVLTEYLAGRPDASAYWSDATKDVYINGIAVPKSEVYLSEDGKAHVSKSVVDRIYAQSLENNPMSAYSIMQNYNKTRDDLYDYLDEIKNYGEFNYDASKDPMYKYYSQYYDMLADKAVDDALTQLMGRTGGYVNSNALSAAYQARNNYLQQKANIIPTLEQNAYDRWSTDRDHYSSTVGDALKNIMSYNSDLANSIAVMKSGELDRENSIYDRAYNYYATNVDDANADAERELQARQYAQSLGLEYDKLSAEQQNVLKQFELTEREIENSERAQGFDEWYKQQTLNRRYSGGSSSKSSGSEPLIKVIE